MTCPKCGGCDIIVTFKPDALVPHVGTVIAVCDLPYIVTGLDTLPGGYKELHCDRWPHGELAEEEKEG